MCHRTVSRRLLWLPILLTACGSFGCGAFFDLVGELVPGFAPSPLPPAGVRLRAENQSELPATVQASYYFESRLVRRSTLHLDAAGPEATKVGLETRADRVLVTAVVAEEFDTSAALVQPGNLLAEAEYIQGEDFSPGDTIAFTVPSPEGPGPIIIDCNGNGTHDAVDITGGTSEDCNGNGIPDECDIADGTSEDCNTNGVPDECDPDCDGNGLPDDCEITACTGDPACGDCNANGIPDECDIADGTSGDCNGNDLPDECDIAAGTSRDLNGNGIPDECDCPAPPTDIGLLAYISNTGSDKVWVVDIVGRAVVAVINVEDEPRGIDIAPDNRRVYVANRFDDSVSVIDTSTNTAVQTIDLAASPLVTADEPYDLVVSRDGQWLYVAMKNGSYGDGSVVVVGLPAGNVVAEAILDSSASPEGIVVTPDGLKVYVAGRGGMYIVDVSTPTAPIFLGTSGWAGRELVGSPDGAWVYANNNAVRTSDDAAFSTGDSSGRRGITITPDGRLLFSTNQNSFLKVVSVTMNGGIPSTTFVTNINDPTQSKSYGIDLTDDGLLGVVSFRWSETVRIFDTTTLSFVGPVIPLEFDPGTGLIFGDEPKQLVISHTLDCNANGLYDACEISEGIADDCNGTGIPDECELAGNDCNGNEVPDRCDIAGGVSQDCNGNLVPDECDPQLDCNNNTVQDICDLAGGTSNDCNGNGIPDECDITNCAGDPACGDCNSNGIPDECDIADGTSDDCQPNGVPDECDTDDLGGFDDHLFVWDGDTLFVSEIATLAAVADIVDPGALGSNGGGDDGRHMVVDTPGRRIFVTHESCCFPDVYDFSLAQLFVTPGVGLSEPLGVAVLPNGQILVTNEEGCLYRLNSDLSFDDTGCGGLDTPEGVAYDSVHDRIFVADEDYQDIEIFDGTTLNHITSVGFCTNDAAYWLGVDGSSNRLFMLADTSWCPDSATGNYGVHVFDILSGGDDLAFNQTLLGSNGGQSNCYRTLAVSESTDRLFALDYCNDTVAIFDTVSLAFLGTVPVGRAGTGPLMVSVGHVRSGTSADCNFNGLPDECELAGCTGDPACGDCNDNGIPDECDIADCPGDPACDDCDGNGIPDGCDLANCQGDPACDDCNGNGVPDGCDFALAALNEKLVASDAAYYDTFGEAVAMSGDTLVIGAEFANVVGSNSGAAYVFQRNGDAWVQQAKLVPSDAAPTHEFGESVSISGDTIVVGADDGTGNVSDSGAAYVFQRSGAVWTEQAKLVASDGAFNDEFGWAVSINGDTIVAGAYLADAAGTDSGAAYVFVRSGTIWSQQAKLVPADPAASDRFGRSVGISGDTIVVGADRADAPGFNSGAAYVFTRSGLMRGGVVWTQQAKLIPSDGGWYDGFGGGDEVSISGETIVVGSDGHNGIGSNSGAAYVFLRSGAIWTEQAKLTAADASSGDAFGDSVSIDGDTLIVGANRDDAVAMNSGSAYIFTRSGTIWTQQAHLTAADGGEFDDFGAAVAVSGDNFAVGAYDNDHTGGFNAGAAYVYYASADCNGNGIPDECDIASGASQDCQPNGIPDECEPDCNSNGIPDECDIADCDGSAWCGDCNSNGIPDGCEVIAPTITEIIDAAGAGVGSSLSESVGIAVDAAGNVYVAGGTSHNAFKITPAGVITEIIDSTGDGANGLSAPLGIAVDAAGNVYVTGAGSNNAFKITPVGGITQIIDAAGDNAGNILDQPWGIAVDASGNAYVAGLDSFNAFKITPGGAITKIIDSTGDGGGNNLFSPADIAVDAAGNVYVAGSASSNAFKITPGGTITEIIDSTGDGAGNGFSVPYGIAVDAAGNVYVAGADSDNAFKITPGGVITEIIDATGDGAGNGFNGFFSGIAVDAVGNVYVAGGGSDNAFKITPAGVITEIIDAAGDGAGNILDRPRGIAVDAAGNAYVTGWFSHNAFKIPTCTTDCNANGIPDECELEACCFEVSPCADLTTADCTAGGGIPQGLDTDCASTNCFQGDSAWFELVDSSACPGFISAVQGPGRTLLINTDAGPAPCNLDIAYTVQATAWPLSQYGFSLFSYPLDADLAASNIDYSPGNLLGFDVDLIGQAGAGTNPLLDDVGGKDSGTGSLLDPAGSRLLSFTLTVQRDGTPAAHNVFGEFGSGGQSYSGYYGSYYWFGRVGPNSATYGYGGYYGPNSFGPLPVITIINAPLWCTTMLLGMATMLLLHRR